jgi:hypothetical protein
MTGDKDLFASLQKVDEDDHVSLADKTKLKIEGIGRINLKAIAYEPKENLAPRDINLNISTDNIIQGKRPRERVAMVVSKQDHLM